MANTEILDNVISTIDSNTRKPEQFLSVQNDIALKLKASIKHLYDFTKEQSDRNTNALPELVTEGFDEEQIWQQLELQNEGELSHILTNVSKVLAGHKQLTIPLSLTQDTTSNGDDESTEKEVHSEQESVEGEHTEVVSNLKKKEVNDKKRKKMKASIVDDKFFKLQELDEYLTKEEKKEKHVNKSADDSDEESVDLFEDFSANEDDNDTEDAKYLKYADFFDSPEDEEDTDKHKNSSTQDNENDESDEEESLPDINQDEDNDDDDDNEEHGSSKKKVKFNLTNDSDETDSIENKADQETKGEEAKSSFQTRKERLQAKIKEMEDEALSEKPWQLKGEVNAANRPQNSLLEEFVEFDVSSRPAPIITEQTTLKLEDIIKQRIKDKTWDDVEKKFKPVETPLEYKKKLILDQEKSKESLSQIYENEYLKQKQALNPESNEREEEEPKLHTEIREMMHSVLTKLDALSNFHYTPKPAHPDLKIISNISAINMEEVAPVTTSDAALLAPEEVRAKPRGELIGKGERTETDRNRERRKKKLRQREKQKAAEKKEKAPSLTKANKMRKKSNDSALLKKLTKDRNITKLDESTQKMAKSSTAFFTQLQDQVKSHIKSKAGVTAKKKDKNALSAIKLKL